ncbi:MAG: hypothetical protein ACXVQ0_01050 [Actinomycetota bacterium]
MSRASVVALLVVVAMTACTGSNDTLNPGVVTSRADGMLEAGGLDSTGWTIAFPPGWHMQTLPACANAPARTGIIVSNVEYRFTSPDGRAPRCEDRLIHPHFPANGIAIALLPVGIRLGAFLPQQPTPFPLAWSQLEIASPGVEGPRAFYLGLVVDAAPVLYVRAWVGDDVSAEVRRQAEEVLHSVAVRGGSRWKPYEDPDGRFTVSVPDGWWVSPPAAAGDDRYGAVATFPVRPFTNVCQAPFPVSLVGMRDGDVAIAIGPATNGGGSTAPRPPRFGPSVGVIHRWHTCQVEGGTLVAQSFTFAEAGAARHVEAGFALMAWLDGALKREVWTLLDTLRFEP